MCVFSRSVVKTGVLNYFSLAAGSQSSMWSLGRRAMVEPSLWLREKLKKFSSLFFRPLKFGDVNNLEADGDALDVDGRIRMDLLSRSEELLLWLIKVLEERKSMEVQRMIRGAENVCLHVSMDAMFAVKLSVCRSISWIKVSKVGRQCLSLFFSSSLPDSLVLVVGQRERRSRDSLCVCLLRAKKYD